MNQEQEASTMWRAEIDALKEKTSSIPKDQKVTAFYGSSSIRLWKELSDDLAPHHVINLGFGGSSYRWCDYFFEEVFDRLYPQEVVLYAGDNDLGNAVPEGEILESVKSILSKIEKKYGDIHISIISVKPSPDRLYLKKNIESLNTALKSLIESNPRGTFINVHPEMLNGGQVRPELYLEDQLHMNRAGYEIWKKVIKMHLTSKVNVNGRNR